MRALAVLVLVAACGVGAPGPGIDAARAVDHARDLAAIGPRVGDSDAARAGAALIERELGQFGVEAQRIEVGVVTRPEIRVLGRVFRPMSIVGTTDPDLVVRFGPQVGKALLVMAHYDTVPAAPGAVDNAAAVGVLIELARVLAAHPPEHPVIVAFTANEEVGLVGAEALADKIHDQVGFAIALDLIGGSGALSINGASELVGASELRWLAAGADRAGVVLRAPLPHRVVSRWWPQAERSDHGPFTRRGIRAIHLYDRGQDGELIDLAYHTSDDTIDRVHRAKLDELGRLLVALATGPDVPAHAGDGFWVPLATNVVVPRWVIVAIEIALAAACLVALVRRRPRKVARDVLLGAVAYAVAVAALWGLEAAIGLPWLHAPMRDAIAALVLVTAITALVHRGLVRLLPPPIVAPPSIEGTRPTGRKGSGSARDVAAPAAAVAPALGLGTDARLAIAVIVPAMIGVAWLAVGAAEIAWIWLVPAACAALAGRWAALATAALPVVLVLGFGQAREAAYNGFMPATVPLAAWIGVLGIGWVAAFGAAVKGRRTWGRVGAWVLIVGCLLAMIAGVLGLVVSVPRCNVGDFKQFDSVCVAPEDLHHLLHNAAVTTEAP